MGVYEWTVVAVLAWNGFYWWAGGLAVIGFFGLPMIFIPLRTALGLPLEPEWDH